MGEWALLHQHGQGTALPTQGHWRTPRAGAASSDLFDTAEPHRGRDHELCLGQHCKFSTGKDAGEPCWGGLRR